MLVGASVELCIFHAEGPSHHMPAEVDILTRSPPVSSNTPPASSLAS